MPAVNQIQLTPAIPRHEQRAYNLDHGIVTESWSPIKGILDEPQPWIVTVFSLGILALLVAHAALAMRKLPHDYQQLAIFRRHNSAMRHTDTGADAGDQPRSGRRSPRRDIGANRRGSRSLAGGWGTEGSSWPKSASRRSTPLPIRAVFLDHRPVSMAER